MDEPTASLDFGNQTRLLITSGRLKAVIDWLRARATKDSSGWRPASDHPGHILSPALAALLSEGNTDKVLLAELEATGRDPSEALTQADDSSKPRLITPSVIALIRRSRPRTALTDSHREAAIDAMRIAAEKRVQGILEHSRRRHYGHAALLVASAPKRRTVELVRRAVGLDEPLTRSENWLNYYSHN